MEYPRNGRRPVARTARLVGRLVLLGLAGAVLVAVSGCSGGSTGASAGSATSSPTVGAHMAGPAADVYVTQAAVDARPKAVDLKTPETAVRSYLDWTTYAYRTGQSALADAHDEQPTRKSASTPTSSTTSRRAGSSTRS